MYLTLLEIINRKNEVWKVSFQLLTFGYSNRTNRICCNEIIFILKTIINYYPYKNKKQNIEMNYI